MKKGFTLIELLVVLAIIGILAAMIIASLSGARARARDATRKSDLRQIKTALEQYYSDQSPEQYPTAASWTALGTILTGGTTPYIKTWPLDPKNSGTYVYSYAYAVTGTLPSAYYLCADLENEKEAATLTITTCTAGGGTGIFAPTTTNRQFQASND